MENRPILKKKLFIIAIAGVIGALLFDGLIVLANILYNKREELPWVDTFSWCLMIPGMVISSITGIWPDEYILYAVVDGLLFSGIAAFWLLLVKGEKGGSNENT